MDNTRTISCTTNFITQNMSNEIFANQTMVYVIRPYGYVIHVGKRLVPISNTANTKLVIYEIFIPVIYVYRKCQQ